ncbi:MAG: cytochrome c oxidase assembly protein [Acidimicrobiales bacterium]
MEPADLEWVCAALLGSLEGVPEMPGMHGVGRLAFDAHNVMTQWEFGPFAALVLVAVIVVGVWYLRAQASLSARGRRWSVKRTVSFLAGLVAIDLALQSPVAAFTADYFQAHVIQHLLLMVVAPPLLAMGAPMTLALQTSSRAAKVRLLSLLNSRPLQLLTHPLPVWFLYYFSMFAFFLTFALGFAMDHMWLMDLINLAFLGASTLFWWPIVGLDPIPHWQMGHGLRMVNLVVGVPIESFLGLALLSSTHAAASMYTVAGTHSGGAILWIGAEFFTFLALIPVFVQWVRFEERKGQRYDAQLDAELAAAEARSGSEPRPAPVAEPLEPLEQR